MVKKHEEKNIKHKEKIPTTFIVILVVVVALLATGAFFIFSAQKPLDYSQYNNFKFTKIANNNWQTMVEMNGQLYEVPFYNHPYDISGVNYNNNVTKHIKDVINTVKPPRKIIIAIHPSSGSVPVLAGVNIARITGKFYGAKTSSALYLEDNEQDTYNSTNISLVNCGDANFFTTIIHLSANETNESVNFVNNNSNCILVGANNDTNLLKVADLVGYKLLGIMS